ncbi:hypothetical protein RJ640_015757 [Escallonia rubra]|uniref:Gag-pol polyprotein n=1 Tax=Escallonia rubra TaxID=112253 RepID=A0AA88QHT0_9ASTE|nr:hypothetical protein RJ640_015757 [Escallonia rubra]
MGNSTSEEVVGIGTYQLKMKTGSSLLLYDVLYAPGVQRNLIYVIAMARLGFSFSFGVDFVSLYLDSVLYGSGNIVDGFYVLDVDDSLYNDTYMISSNKDDASSSKTWHNRLGHIGHDRMTREVRKDVELYEMVESDGVSTLSLSKGGDFNYQHGHDDPMSVEDSRSVPLNSQRGYSDADWSGDLDEHKSTSGYAFLLSNGAISWSSKKQSCIALSTMESEYVACSVAVQEVVWLKRFLQQLEIVPHVTDPMTIYCDSMAALGYAKDPKYHGKTKHIETRYQFIRDRVAHGEVVQSISLRK